MPRPPRPDNLYELRVPIELRVSPDGRHVAFTLQSSAPRRDGYRTAIWVVPTDGSAPARQLTLGSKSDRAPRWSPDGGTLAFLSDRAAVLAAGGGSDTPGRAEAPKEGGTQVWLLPFGEGGEARQLTRLPRDVNDLAWSPDGRRLCVVSASTRRSAPPGRDDPARPPDSDLRLIDRLKYQANGIGFLDDKRAKLWLVDVDSGDATRLTAGPGEDEQPAWSPDGRRIGFVSARHRDADLDWRSDVYVVDVGTRRVVRVTDGEGQVFMACAFSPDGEAIATIGFRERWPAGSTRTDVWRFAAEGNGGGENLTGAHDLMVAATLNSDLFGAGPATVHWQADGRWIVFGAPLDGSYQLWRVAADGGRLEQLTEGEHHLAGHDLANPDRGPAVAAAVRAAPTVPPEIVALDVPRGPLRSRARLAPRSIARPMAEAWADVALVAPEERWHEVDGRRIQAWYYPPAAGRGRAPLVVEIHGGPATLYGWTLMWEWQCLAAAGMGVYACNPRGSDGYGQEFMAANYRDWGDGPMRDIMAGVDSLIAQGRADPDRLGVTGGSYGGYLTSWIVGHTDRFRAAVTCRSVNDMSALMQSGDIGGPEFGRVHFGATPWDDPDLFRAHSPLSYASQIRTPLLIQHAERDLRTTVTQAEELFSVLRSLRRPVRLLRVPEESHELTRSGTPFRRVANLELIVDWFRDFLVDGRTRLPPVRRRSPAAARRGAR
jgi:dipeptidyl aminopeptidase/acylaminoacyl peptidase